MTPEARIAAAIDILDRILQGAPAEPALTGWARGHRFAGSGDRAAIRDIVFDALRRRRSLAWLGGAETGRGLMLGRLRAAGEDAETVFTGLRYAPPPLSPAERAAGRPLADAPDPVRLDCPDWLWPHFTGSLGGAAEETLAALQERAPVFLRVNAARSTRAAAATALAAEGIEARPHVLAAGALEVTGGARKVQNARAYREGLVEVQDAASQAVIERLAPRVRNARVLDYCAGGGGKALAMAAAGADSVTAHDADPRRMKDLPGRAARAGTRIRTTRTVSGHFDLVLCDAPCSGSGVWRRQPDAKWRLTGDRLAALTQVQDEILARARSHVAPGGGLAYATCSLFDVENGGRVRAFLHAYPDWHLADRLHLTPADGGDGFFLAVFTRN